MAQGKPGPVAVSRRTGLWAVLFTGLLVIGPVAGAGPRACPGPTLRIEALGPALWWLPAAGGVADERNRGQVINLVVARHGDGLWLLGSGPSPVFGRRLRCQLEQRLGLRVAGVVNPLARAEAVLGNHAFAGVPLWAPRAVAEAMARQCPTCVARLRRQLGRSADDLGVAPTRLPRRLLDGDGGTLGPFAWRLAERTSAQTASPTSVWRVHTGDGGSLVVAFGLLEGEGPPDGRDADIHRLPALLDSLLAEAGPGDGVPRWLGDHGPPLDRDEVARQRDYWRAVVAAAADGVAAGLTLPSAAPALPIDEAWARSERHALNWQRAWRQAEDRALAPPSR